MKNLYLLLIIFLLIILPVRVKGEIFAVQGGVIGGGPFMIVFNENTWEQISYVQLTMEGFHVIAAPAITWNTSDLKLYAIVTVEEQIFNANHLVTVNPATGVCTNIGQLGAKKTSLGFSSLTYNSASGILYAMGGVQGVPGVSGCLYSINMNTAEPAFLAGPFAANAFGQVIAYNLSDNMIYLWAGNGPSFIMEKIDPIFFSPTPVALSGNLNTAILGAVYTGANFSAAGIIDDSIYAAFTITSGGFVDSVASLAGQIAGLAYADPTLPVELIAFSSAVNSNNVTLNWSTSSEINNSGFDVERKLNSMDWVKVGSVSGNGTSTNVNHYSFSDRGLNSGTYSYRLKQIDFNGNYEFHNLSNEVFINTPSEFKLSQNYPNPFNPVTVINYKLPVPGLITLNIFDVNGKEVSVLINEFRSPGEYDISFDGRNLSSGMYFYSLNVNGNIIDTKRMTLLK